jgi:hypothetical protein
VTAKPLPRALLALALALAGLAACAPRYSPFEIDAKLARALVDARTHLEQRRGVEAEQLIRAVQRIDPEYYGLAELVAGLPARERDLFRASWLGANRARRYSLERPPAARALLFLPDRLLDLLDVVSIEAHFGPGADGEAHVTQGARVALGLRVIGGLGSYFRRTLLGTRVQGNAALHALGAGPLRSLGVTAGTGGVASGGGDLSGFRSARDPVYQSYEDYWSIGGSGTAVFGGFSAELHLVQLADWVGGFLLADLGNDDLARTRPLALRASERVLLQELAEIEQSRDLLAQYRLRRPELQIPGSP